MKAIGIILAGGNNDGRLGVLTEQLLSCHRLYTEQHV